MQPPEKFKDYAAFAARQVRWKLAREPVERELLCHLMDQRDALVDAGMEPEAAEAESLRLTGDAVEIGEELDRIHRPRPQKGMLLLTGLLLALGLAVQVFIELRIDRTHFYLNLTAWVLGAIACAAIYHMDFTLLARKPLLTYGAVTLSVLAASLCARKVNGVSVTAAYLALLLPVGYAALLCRLRNGGWFGVLFAFLGLLPPMFASMTVPSIFGAAATALTGAVLLISALRRDWFGLKGKRGTALWTSLGVLVFCAAACVMLVSRSPGAAERLGVVFQPERDPNGMGYRTLLIREALQGARFFGTGTLAAPERALTLFDWRSDFLLTLLIHEVGWCAAGAVLLAFGAFFALAFRKALRIGSLSGRMFALAVLAVLLAETLVYLAANLGFVLLLSPALPLMSPGGAQLVVNLALIGLLLSTLRGGALPETMKEKPVLN